MNTHSDDLTDTEIARLTNGLTDRQPERLVSQQAGKQMCNVTVKHRRHLSDIWILGQVGRQIWPVNG